MSKYIKIDDKNNGSKNYKVVSTLANDELDVTILDGEHCYTSQIKIEDMHDFANSFETTVDQYMIRLHRLLSEKSTAKISVIKDELTVYKNENIKYFVKKIEKCNYNVKLENLLVNVFKEKSNLQLKVDKLEEERREIINECTSLKALLEEKVNEHSSHEKKLLSSFALLLNEKKRRIQYLTDALDSQIINSVPSKRVKLDHSDEELSSKEVSDAENSNKNNISDDEDNGETILSNNDENDDNSKLLIDESTKISNYEENNDDDEDILLRSPEDSPTRELGMTSLPKRVSSGSSSGVSFRENAKEVKPSAEESQQQSVISTEAQFTSQDILDRLFN